MATFASAVAGAFARAFALALSFALRPVLRLRLAALAVEWVAPPVIVTITRRLVRTEATASVDMETDACIQRSLRENIQQWTVLTIAHRCVCAFAHPFPPDSMRSCFRLATIADYDLIIGMEGGRVVEVGKPDELLARGSSGSLFASLYSHM